ncbi:hypothetical protein I6A84_23160 [Frankia sp. CNm7]|uniref:Uncharacterized protein n=1 Tax=Frankia nepalensis TaxID=1836974 RepID=A0A937RBA5_9ACTN|nr:hypothetical protein [Frankia nepalensis]MBL7499219.1 hypothetical protein [Frankia nepalensis]MBL7512135.1 hypothetical protein [Frankia nepalensis]MBL7520906.1 hypothetical protein [Frankia nepalensis]MBL7627290.1 hypothetical protein [Frankia nepalensis]
MSTLQPAAAATGEPFAPRGQAAPVPGTADDTRTRRAMLGAGGLLFAVGNLLHPLEHNEAAEHAATWAAAHVIFAIGAVLIAAGLPLFARRFGAGRLAAVARVLTWVGFVTMPANAVVEVFVAPNVDHETLHAVESDMTVAAAPLGFAFILGVLLFGVAALRAGGPLRPVGTVLAAGGALLLVGPGLPIAEGYWIIPTTAAIGLAFTGVAVMAVTAGSRGTGRRRGGGS